MGHSAADEGAAIRADAPSGSGGSAYVHKLKPPSKPNLLEEIGTGIKETFFSDDPLREFKNQPVSRKLYLSLVAVFPIFGWAREYSLKKFKGDLIAGLTIASLCIPQVRVRKITLTNT